MTPLTTRTGRRAGLALATVLSLSALAACGSDDAGSADGGNGGGETVKVMVFGPFDAEGFSEPWVETAAQAGVDKVNADGGIGGRDLELIACNDENNPNTAAGCAKQAVREGVVAVIGGISTVEDAILPPLAQAGIPVIATTPVADFTSPNLFPITGGAAGALFGLGKTMAEDPVCGGKVAGLIEDFGATQGAIQLFQLGVMASGGEYTGTSKTAQGSADFAPAVAAAAGQSPCVGFLTGPQSAAQAARAALSDGNVALLGTSDSVLGDAALASLGAEGDGIIIASPYLPLNDSTDTPEMAEFLEAGLAVDDAFAPDQTAAGAFIGPRLLQLALEGVDDITAESVTEALKTVSGYDTGLGPIVDFSATNPTKAFSRLPAATPLFRLVAKGGSYTDAGGDPLDVSGIYDAAAKAGQ